MKSTFGRAVPTFTGPIASKSAIALFVAATLSSSALWAQEATSEVGEVVVTGTRQGGLSAAASPTPIQVVEPEEIEAAGGNTDLMKALSQLIPSLTSQTFGNGSSAMTLMVRLKGLSPNHVLILVNGKRRHGTSALAVNASGFVGGASADLNFIPIDAIDHVEVLTDGAAAQYGSDAIAGVVNIILKKSASGGTVSAMYGENFDDGLAGDTLPFSTTGGTTRYSANIGLTPGENAWLNLSGEVRNHGHTFHGDPDVRTTAASNLATAPNNNMLSAPGYPYLNWIQGDAAYHSQVASYDGGYDFGSGMQFYSFGTYGTKSSDAYQNYRLPNVYKYTSGGVTTYPYPFGFSPVESIDETDYGATVGLKSELAGWRWDLSSTYGRDRNDIYTRDSANTTYYATTGLLSQTDFYDGALISTQWTTDLDVNRDFDFGLASATNVAFGIEYRRDGYEISSGDIQAWNYGGAAGNAGYSPQDSGLHTRTSQAAYLDLGGLLTEKLRVDLATRFEHFSDFGSKTVGKATARYDFAPAFALRGTVSTGFRAPTLAEEYYSAISVGPASISAQLPPNGAAAGILGLGDLKPERSTNYSIGAVLRPTERMTASIDAYQIDVKDRIVASSTLYGTLNGATASQLVNDVLAASGVVTNGAGVTSTGVTLFTNGVDTRTRGVDVAFEFPVKYGPASVDWKVGATYNDTEVTRVRTFDPALVAALNGSPVYSNTTLANLSTASPKYVVNLGGRLEFGRLTVSLLEKIYGKSESWASTTSTPTGARAWYLNTVSAAVITDLDLSWDFSKALKVTLGATNLFNKYPNKINPDLLAAVNSSIAVTKNDAASGTPYPIFSPYGFNGGFYYMRATYAF